MSSISLDNEEIIIVEGVAIRKIRIQLTKDQQKYVKWDIEMAKLKSPSLPNYTSYNVTNEYIELQIPAEFEKLQDLINRKKSQNQMFTEQEIITILFQLITTFYSLHKIGILARCATPRFIRMKNNQITLERCGYTYEIYSYQDQIQIAPELISEESFSHKVDVWILGMIAYNLMFLKPLYEKQNLLNYKAFIEQCSRNGNTFDFLITTQYSNDLVSLLQQMLKFDPESRIEIFDILTIYRDLFRGQSQKMISEMIRFYEKEFQSVQWLISYRFQKRQLDNPDRTKFRLKKSRSQPKLYQIPQKPILRRQHYNKKVSYSYEDIHQPKLLYKFQASQNENDQKIIEFWNKFNFVLYQIYLISNLREAQQNTLITNNLTFYLKDVLKEAIKILENDRTISYTNNAIQCLKELKYQLLREIYNIELIQKKDRITLDQMEAVKYLDALIRAQHDINPPERQKLAFLLLILLKDQFKEFQNAKDQFQQINQYNGIYKIDNYMHIDNFIERAPLFYLGELINSIIDR